MSPIIKLEEGNFHIRSRLPVCSLCGPSGIVRKVTMPFAFKFLIAELASVGISTKLGLQTAENGSRSSAEPQVSLSGDFKSPQRMG